MKSWDFLTKSIRIEGFEDPCIFGHGNEQNPLDNSSLYYVTRDSTRCALPACHLKGAGGAFCSLSKGWILVLSRITLKRILWNSAWWYTNTITLYSSIWRMAHFKDHMFGTVRFSFWMWVYWTFALLVSLNAMHSDLCCLQTISFSSCTNPPPVSLTPFQGHGRGFFVDIGSAENEGGGRRTGSARTSVLVSEIGWYPKVHRASHPHHRPYPTPLHTTDFNPHPLNPAPTLCLSYTSLQWVPCSCVARVTYAVWLLLKLLALTHSFFELIHLHVTFGLLFVAFTHIFVANAAPCVTFYEGIHLKHYWRFLGSLKYCFYHRSESLEECVG